MSRLDRIFLDLHIFSCRHDGWQRYCWIVVVMRDIILSIRLIKCHWSNIMASIMYIAFLRWKKMPRCNQQHDVLIPFDWTTGRCCNPHPSYLMSLNFLDQIIDGWALCRIPLLSNLIPRLAPPRHEVGNCRLMEFYGGRAGLVWQIIFTGLRSAKGLVVGQVSIDVNISDLRQPFWGGAQCCRHTQCFQKKNIREFMQEEYVVSTLVLNLLNFGSTERLNFWWGDVDKG